MAQDFTAPPAPITPDPATTPVATDASTPVMPDPGQAPIPAAPSPTTAPAPQPSSSGPAQAPASAGVKSKTPGGVLGSIALGALAGAKHALVGTEKVLNTVARNSEVGQQLQKNAIERQSEQQAMDLKAKQEQRAQAAFLTDEDEKKIRTNGMSLDNAHKVIENAHIEAMYPGQEEEQRNVLIEQHRTQNAADRDLISTLASMGVKVDVSHGPGHDGLSKDHATSVAQGRQTMLNNGQTGDDAGYAFVNNAELQNTPLPADVKVISDWSLDPKTGEIKPVTTTLSAAHNTAWDALIVHDAASKKFQQLQDQYGKQLANAKEVATIGEAKANTNKANAEANKANAEAKITSQINPPGSVNLTGEDYLKTIPAAYANVIRAIGEGRETRSPRQLQDKNGNPTPLAEALHQAYPDFDIAKAGEWPKARNEYMGTGQTAKKVVSYNTSMEHMQALFDSTTPDGMFNPASKDYQRRQAELGFVANEVGNAIKNGVMSKDEAESITKGISGALTPGLNRERIKETAKLLHDKTAEYQTKFEQAAPSAGIRVPILMSPKAAGAYDYVQSDGKNQPQIVSAGTTLMKGPDGTVIPIPNANVEAAKQRGAVVVQ